MLERAGYAGTDRHAVQPIFTFCTWFDFFLRTGTSQELPAFISDLSISRQAGTRGRIATELTQCCPPPFGAPCNSTGLFRQSSEKNPALCPISGWQSAASTFCICSIYPENTDDLLEIVSLLFVIVFCIFIPEMSRHAHTHSHRNRLQAAEKPSPQIITQVCGLFAIHLLSDQFLLILLPPTGEKCSTRQDHFCLYLAAVFFVSMFQGLTCSCYTELQ